MRHFLDIRFPTDISCGSSGGPEYLTDVITTASGHECRNSNWLYPRRHFNVGYGIKTQEQFDKLSAFFHNCKGRAIAFRFKDWSDYKANDEVIGKYNEEFDNIRNSEFQLCKHYKSTLIDGNEVEVIRPIFKPVFDSVELNIMLFNGGKFQKIKTLKCNQTNITNNAKYDAVVDYDNGHVKLTKPLSSNEILTASFEFDIAARFDTDSFPVVFEGSGFHSINGIPVIEIKL